MKSILFLLLLLIGFNASSQAELVQLRPQTEGDVPKNELLELEIPFDSATWSKVHRFVYSGISSGLNPYDPEKIDITAEFFIERDGQWVRKGKTFGFYFQDFFRDTTADIERWSWRKIGRDKFLVRYAPNEIGKWKVEFRITSKESKHQVNINSYLIVSIHHVKAKCKLKERISKLTEEHLFR